MKRSLISIILLMAFCMALSSAEGQEANKTEQYLGERKMCLDVVRIKESIVLDNQTILFETRGGAFYLSRLPAKCPGLYISGGFGYDTPIDKFCKQDSIQVIEPGSNMGSTCMMGEFVRFNHEGTISEARKLLKDGLLDTLVEESAFKEAFPAKKPE